MRHLGTIARPTDIASQSQLGSSAVVAGTKTLIYTAGVLTSVNGPGAATKTLTYTAGALTQVQAVAGGVTVTKTLAYSAGRLTGITTAIT